MKAAALRRSKAGTVEIPTKLFVELYFAAPLPLVEKLDELLGQEEVDRIIRKVEQLKE